MTKMEAEEAKAELFEKLRLRSPIAMTKMEAEEAIFNCISPSLRLLVTLNPYKELQIWLVAPESIHQERQNQPQNKTQ